MEIKFLKSSDKKKVLMELEKIYGVKDLRYLFISSGKERIRGFTGNLSKEEIAELGGIVRIETIGLYLFSIRDGEPRISFDALSLIRESIGKSIVKISSDDFNNWIRGRDLDISSPEGFVVVCFNNDFVGIGRSNGEKIFNYVPKERKLRK